MSGDIDIIHHPGLIARNIDAAVAQYERLGFFFTPLSIHRIAVRPNEEPVYFGTGNRNAIFERNFLEIVGVVDQARWSQISKAERGPFNIDERLGLYQGLHIMHFGADDIDVVRARFARQGISCFPTTRLQREVDTPQGSALMQALAMNFAKGENPEALMQIAQHLTRDVALQPRYIRHENGARLLTEVIVCGENAEQLASKYARYTHRDVRRSRSLFIVDLGHSRVVVLDPQGLEHMVPGFRPPRVPFLAGITVATGDLAQARDLFEARGISLIPNDDRWIVGPEDACGCAVVFEALGASR